jgi:NhaA family Na+:H+ antiporter
MMVPGGARRTGQESVLKFFVDSLHPYVAYGILPLFAFTAAGFSLRALTPGAILSPLPLGLIAALVIGKPLGVFGFAGLTAVARLGRRPAGTTWLELLGVALICGVGFTLSFFIGGLAFAGAGVLAHDQLRLGVVVGSLISALAGAALLVRAQGARLTRDDEAD